MNCLHNGARPARHASNTAITCCMCSLTATACIAIILKGGEANSIWLSRLIKGLQLFAIIICTIFWPAILDYFAFLWDCHWSVSLALAPTHRSFTDQSELLAVLHCTRAFLAACVCYTWTLQTTYCTKLELLVVRLSRQCCSHLHAFVLPLQAAWPCRTWHTCCLLVSWCLCLVA